MTKTNDFDPQELYEAAHSDELKEQYAKDVEELREEAKSLYYAESSLQHLKEEAHEAVLQHISDYDEQVERLEKEAALRQKRIKQIIGKYSPGGGVKVRFGDRTYGTKRASEKLVVHPECLTEQWLEDLSILIDDRPLVVPTLDEKLLREGIRRDILDQDELVEAGIVEVKRRTPAWYSAGNREGK